MMSSYVVVAFWSDLRYDPQRVEGPRLDVAFGGGGHEALLHRALLCGARCGAEGGGEDAVHFCDFLRLSEKGIKKECFFGLVDQFGIV